MQRLETIGRYVPREPLGAGGFATVYRAYDPVLDRLVALKVLHPHLSRDHDVAERFVREGRALARVRHPNIVQVHDAGDANGVAWLAMELVEGRPLDQLVLAGSPLPLAALAAIVDQVAAALAAVHGCGLVHRDVKPDNILIEARTGRAVLLDLGLARMADARHGSLLGLVVGTPAFMAPEQVISGGQVSVRTDVYQLAATVLFLVTGMPPFAGATIEVLHQIASRPPPALAGLQDRAPHLAAVLTSGLAKDPARRPASPTLLAATIRAALLGPGSDGFSWRWPMVTSQQEPADWAITRRVAAHRGNRARRHRRTALAVALAATCLVGAGAAGALYGRAAGADDGQAPAPIASVIATPAVSPTITTTPTPPSPTVTVTATPSRTATPTPPPARTPAPTPSARSGFDVAELLMGMELYRRGLTPSGPMAATAAPGGTLYARAGSCINRASARCQSVLFMLDRRVLETDTPHPTNTIRAVRAAGEGTIAVVYARYARTDPDCCPSLPDVTITYRWNGSRLIASGQPPGGA